MTACELDEDLKHPSFLIRHAGADEYTFNNVFLPTYRIKQSFFARKISNGLHKLKIFLEGR